MPNTQNGPSETVSTRLSTRKIFTRLAALARHSYKVLPDWIVYSQLLGTYLAAGLPFFVQTYLGPAHYFPHFEAK